MNGRASGPTKKAKQPTPSSNHQNLTLMEKWVIDAAKPADFATIAAIYNEYIRLGNATMVEKIHAATDIQQWVDNFNDREKLFVMRSKKDVIGWGIIKRYSDRMGYRFACETSIFFTASALRKGYGSQMKKFLITLCKNLNYRHLVAKIFAQNTASIAYNLQLGYEIVGRQKKVGFKNGKWMDVVIMQYLIEK
ncbi:MAG: L-amino acid N-acyltransferase YncA [Paraglaciecola sp.]